MMNRPHCLRCRREMRKQSANKSGGARWACRPGGVFCTAQYARHLRAPVNDDLPLRPRCVACRRAMERAGKKDGRRFRCPACRVTVSARPRRAPFRRDPTRPTCADCGRLKTSHSVRGKRYFYCHHCSVRRRAVRRNSDEAAAFVRQVAAALPGHLSHEEREDAAQSVYLDVLAAKLAPVVPSSLVLRRYASQARGMSGDRFRFISLSQPTRDGREFGDMLAA